jgi:hypothetical protein
MKTLESEGIVAYKCNCGKSRNYCISGCNLIKNTFIQGYACCLATIIQSHGISTEVREAFKSGIGTLEVCVKANIDQYDLDILKAHFE